MLANELKNLMENKTRLGCVALALTVILFGYLLLFKYDLGGYRRSKLYVITSKTDLQVMKQADEFKSLIDAFGEKFAKESGTDRIMSVINDIAEEEGVILDLLKPEEPDKTYGYKLLRVKAEGTAPFLTLLGIISRIESSERHLFIESLTVDSTATTKAYDSSSDSGLGGADPITMAKFNLIVSTIGSKNE